MIKNITFYEIYTGIKIILFAAKIKSFISPSYDMPVTAEVYRNYSWISC